MNKTALIATGAGAATVLAAGSGTATDALDAIVITLAVVIVLAVAGMLALLVMRVRRGVPARGPERPVAAGWTVMRVDVTASPERAATALPVTRKALPRG